MERCQGSVRPRIGRDLGHTSIAENSSLMISARRKAGAMTKIVRKVSKLSVYVLRYVTRIRYTVPSVAAMKKIFMNVLYRET